MGRADPIEIVIPPTWDSVEVNGSNNGNNELVAAVPRRRIYVVGLVLIGQSPQGGVHVTIQSGIGGRTLITDLLLPTDGDGLVMPIPARGWWCRTDVGESLNMNLGAAVPVTGVLTYYTAG